MQSTVSNVSTLSACKTLSSPSSGKSGLSAQAELSYCQAGSVLKDSLINCSDPGDKEIGDFNVELTGVSGTTVIVNVKDKKNEAGNTGKRSLSVTDKSSDHHDNKRVRTDCNETFKDMNSSSYHTKRADGGIPAFFACADCTNHIRMNLYLKKRALTVSLKQRALTVNLRKRARTVNLKNGALTERKEPLIKSGVSRLR